jgi:hypothetical protein
MCSEPYLSLRIPWMHVGEGLHFPVSAGSPLLAKPGDRCDDRCSPQRKKQTRKLRLPPTPEPAPLAATPGGVSVRDGSIMGETERGWKKGDEVFLGGWRGG